MQYISVRLKRLKLPPEPAVNQTTKQIWQPTLRCTSSSPAAGSACSGVTTTGGTTGTRVGAGAASGAGCGDGLARWGAAGGVGLGVLTGAEGTASVGSVGVLAAEAVLAGAAGWGGRPS